MNTAIRITATWALGLILGLAVTAQAQTPNPLEFTTRLTPSPGNWFSPDSNFGGIVFDFNTDPNRPVAFGLWQYFENGESKVVYFQADLDYSTQDEIEDTGIIATMNSPTFVFVGRGDYDDPVPDSGTTQLTGRNIRIQFTSSRTGTFIDNPGQPDERTHPIVGTVRGLPLVAPIEYTGDWMVAARLDTSAAHRDFVGVVKLEPYVGPEAYAFHDIPINNLPLANFDPPQPGARRYRMFCPVTNPNDAANTATPCDWVAKCSFNCPTGLASLLLWVNPDETGGVAAVFTQATQGVLVRSSFPIQEVFGDSGKLTLRSRDDFAIKEAQFVKIADDVFRFE